MTSSSASSLAALTAALGAPPSQLLTRDNALVWKALVIPALRGARVLNLVKGLEKPPAEEIEVELADGKKMTVENTDYVAWITRDQQVLRYILNSISPDILSHVIGLETSAEVWKALEALTTPATRSRTQQLRSALNDTKKGDLSTEKYVSKLKNIAAELAAAGKPLDDDELIWSVLHGLGDSYNTLKTAVNANPNTTLTDLCSQLQAFDQLHKVDDGGEVFVSSANIARRGDPPLPRRQQDDQRQGDHGYQEDRRVRPYQEDRARHDNRGHYDDRRYDSRRYDDRRGYDDRRDRYDDRRDGGGDRRYDDRSRRRDDDGNRHRDDGGRRDDGRRRGRAPTPYVNVTCQICKIHGHPANDCWWRFQNNRDRRDDGDRGDKGANMVSYGVDTNWYSDTGATNHVANEMSKLSFQERYTGHDQVHTANGKGSGHKENSL